MASIKIIGIRLLDNCSEVFSKSLKKGYVYRFYNEYEFLDQSYKPLTENSEPHYILKKEIVPGDLYSTNTADGRKLQVDISAVVGKNGAGKSSLVEILYGMLYVISIQRNILKPSLKSIDSKLQISRQNDYIENKKSKLYGLRSRILADIRSNASLSDTNFAMKDVLNSISEYERKMKAILDSLPDESDLLMQRQEIMKVLNNLKAELYYEFDGIIYRLRVNSSEFLEGFELRKLSLSTQEPKVLSLLNSTVVDNTGILSKLFYTIGINYSHYALNSSVLGDWITRLFHKNDGYETPVVLSPMRDEGNITINKEIKFAKYRLLYNILFRYKNQRDNRIFISEKQYVSKIRFTLNVNKVEKAAIKKTSTGINGELRSSNMVTDILQAYFPGLELAQVLDRNSFLTELVMNYIVQKVDRISSTYKGFEMGYTFSSLMEDNNNAAFIQKLQEETSHVVFKFNQAINFLKHEIGHNQHTFERQIDQSKSLQKVNFDFTVEQLLEWMGDPNEQDIINHLPPSVFDIDIILSDGGVEQFSFEQLSSGEQQFIHSLQSVIYHLNNLQSIHSSDPSRTNYSRINIIYDEIELYFHPELQKRFVKEILKSLEHVYIKKDSNIDAINIILLTHSPFILSDLPKENIMRLKRYDKTIQEQGQTQSFGGNIHDLLTENFFLGNTLIGDHSDEVITGLVDRLENNTDTDEDLKLINIIGDPVLKSALTDYKNNRND